MLERLVDDDKSAVLEAFLLLSLVLPVLVLDPRLGAFSAVVAVRGPVPRALDVVVEILAAVGRGVDIHWGDVDHLGGADNERTDDGWGSSGEERDTIRTEAETDVGRGQGAAQAEGPGEGVCLRGHHGDSWGP